MTNSLLDDHALLETGRARSALEAFEHLGLKEEDFIWTGRPKQGFILEPLDFFVWLLGLVLLFFGGRGFYEQYNAVEFLPLFFYLVFFGLLIGIFLYILNAYRALYIHFPSRYLVAFALVGEIWTWWQVDAVGLYLGWFYGGLVYLGLYLLFLGHWQDLRQRQAIWYGLTEDELLIHFSSGLARYSLQQLDISSLERRTNQQGSILLNGELDKTHQPVPYYWLRANAPNLYYIPDIENVNVLLQKSITTAKITP